MKRTLSIAFGILIGVSVFGQSIERDFQKISDKYNLDSFNAKYQYEYYINGKIESNDQVEIQRTGTKYYAKTSNLTQISTKDYSIAIYPSSKLVVVSDAVRLNDTLMELDYSKLLKSVKSHSMTIDSLDQRAYLLYLNDGQDYEKISLSFNPLTFEINYIEYFEVIGQDTAKLRVTFKQFKYKNLNKALYNTTKFITTNGNSFTLDKKYKKYKLVDNRINLKR